MTIIFQHSSNEALMGYAKHDITSFMLSCRCNIKAGSNQVTAKTQDLVSLD